jgi:hypothetical protein
MGTPRPRGERVGRFAADKLASRLDVMTRKSGMKEIHATFCWSDYDDDSRLLSDITSDWEARARRPGPGVRNRFPSKARAR